MKNIADLHIHPSLKPYQMKGYVADNQVDMWREYQENKDYLKKIPSLIRGAIKETAKYSQANLDKLMEAKVKTAFFTIYAIERGMFDLRSKYRKKNIQRCLLDLILKPKHYPYLGAAVAGMPLEKVEKILNAVNNNEGINYFEKETYDEYQFLVRESSKTSPTGKKFKIVSSYQELKSVDTDTIGAILSLEGAHSLGNISKHEYFYKAWNELTAQEQVAIRSDYLLNVNRLKGTAEDRFSFDKKHTPFLITLSHMFNNFLTGHAKTFGHGALILPGTADLFDQKTAMNEGISSLGFEVIEQLLSRENGRRILLDVKHLSMASRNQLYQYIDKNYNSKGDHLPLIGSHIAVNGFEKNDLSRKDNPAINRNQYFNRGSINFSNEDIRKVYESGGILGLVPHEGTMPGPVFKARLKELSFKGKQEAYLKLFWSNVYQIVYAINDKKAWQIICLGTDFDGLMDPFNCYPDATYLPKLANDMEAFIAQTPELVIYKNNKQTKIKRKEIDQLMFGYNCAELVEMIFTKNLDRFLSKYFTDEYLEEGVVTMEGLEGLKNV